MATPKAICTGARPAATAATAAMKIASGCLCLGRLKFAAAVGQVRSRIDRDAYSLLHYPLVVGIVFYAVAVEEIVAHPDEPLDTFGRLALSLGVSLALLAIAASVYRVTRRIPSIRIGTAVLIMAIGAVAGSWNAVIFASAIAAVTVASLVWTQLRPWQDPIPDVQTPTPS